MLVQLVRSAAAQRKWLHTMQGPGMPLGLAYVAGALEQAGHRVTILDAVLEGHDRQQDYGPIVARGLPNDEVVARIDANAGAIGVTAMFSVDWLLIADLCLRIRERFPGVPIILGGEHVTALPEFSLLTSGADYAVLGEGEETAAELVDAIARGNPRSVAGIAYRDGDRVVLTPPRGRIRDLTRLARPAWHLFDVARYHHHRINGSGLDIGEVTIPILASRGCPYQCTFCAAPSMWNAWVPRDPVDVVDEIQSLNEKFGARNFPFYDLTAIVRRSWIEQFCRELVRRKLDITWQLGVGTRIEELDDDVARMLHESGMYYVAFAPESGSDDARKRIKKRLDQSDLVRATNAALAAGLRVEFMMVLGFPEDTDEDMQSSVRLAWWAGKMGVHDIGPGIFTPVPGTELFDELFARGAIAFDEELLFATITNFGFWPRYVQSLRVPPARTIAYLYAVALSFYASRLVHHPRAFLGEMSRTATDRADSGMLGRILKGSARAAVQTLLGARTRVRLPTIDYGRHAASSLRRRERPRLQPEHTLRRTAPI
jgi:radical SAM superfamily enzyme YgiQ (UPF0313 family)